MRAVLIIAILTITCSIEGQGTSDYFGQSLPHDIPEIFAPDLISIKNRFEYGISFSPDCKAFAYGVLDMKDESGQIYYAERINNKWTEPDTAGFLGHSSMYLPFFTPDGKSLLYTQTQQDSATYITDIWMVNRLDNRWDKPIKLTEPVNSSTREGSVCMTLNKTIYFSSGRNCIGAAYCPAMIYSSKLNEGKYLKAEKEMQLNIRGDNESIFVSADESFAILSNVTNNKTNTDLYISYRDKNNAWSAPFKLDSTINTKDWELRPYVSMDNKLLFFTRMTSIKNGFSESDIYWVDIERILKKVK